MALELTKLEGRELRNALGDLADLRITVFRDWPYLYEGSKAYEEEYLGRYAHTEGALIIAAYDGGRLVGAATGEPLEQEVIQFRKPFEDQGMSPGSVFYLAESLLLPEFRGQGIGHAFFDAREAHARDLGYESAAFCAVIRPDNHPMRPAGYTPLDPFWEKRGYRKMESGIVYFPWQDVGEREETEKPMQVWIRDI